MSTPIPDQPDFCWPIDPACLGDIWSDYDEAVQARAVALATASLYRLTLGRVGGCPITVRPCPQRGSQGLGSHLDYLGSYGAPVAGVGWFPVNWAGSWVNCGCANICGCATGCEIALPGYVGRVDEVNVSGSVVDPTKYRLVNNSKIVWQGGGDCPFPKQQSMATPMGDAGTLSVTYLPAHEVDGLAAYAAGILAAEFAKACTGNKGCRLPKGTTAIARQGVNITIVSGAFPNGLTGINEVDAWVSLWNPNKLTSMPKVWSPDMDEFQVES